MPLAINGNKLNGIAINGNKLNGIAINGNTYSFTPTTNTVLLGDYTISESNTTGDVLLLNDPDGSITTINNFVHVEVGDTSGQVGDLYSTRGIIWFPNWTATQQTWIAQGDDEFYARYRYSDYDTPPTLSNSASYDGRYGILRATAGIPTAEMLHIKGNYGSVRQGEIQLTSNQSDFSMISVVFANMGSIIDSCTFITGKDNLMSGYTYRTTATSLYDLRIQSTSDNTLGITYNYNNTSYVMDVYGINIGEPEVIWEGNAVTGQTYNFSSNLYSYKFFVLRTDDNLSHQIYSTREGGGIEGRYYNASNITAYKNNIKIIDGNTWLMNYNSSGTINKIIGIK